MTLNHVPVLLKESVEALSLRAGSTVIDATLGLGGHASTILKATAPNGQLLGIERTKEGLAEAARRLNHYSDRVTLVRADFRDLARIATKYRFESVDSILFDLGLASWQIDTGHQGLSFQLDTPLDMRLSPYLPQDFTRKVDDPTQWTENAALARTVRAWRFRSAADFLAQGSEADISNVLRQLGDVSSARSVAQRIIAARPIETTKQLADALGTTDPKRLAPVFQALRILAGDEYGALVAALHDSWQLIAPGGRLAVISFHSGEDRITKRLFRQFDRTARSKPMKAGPEEINANPRARSATLRTVIKQLTNDT